MSERIKSQLAELRSRFLALDAVRQEAVLMMARLLSDDANEVSDADLHHLQRDRVRREREWQEREKGLDTDIEFLGE